MNTTTDVITPKDHEILDSETMKRFKTVLPETYKMLDADPRFIREFAMWPHSIWEDTGLMIQDKEGDDVEIPSFDKTALKPSNVFKNIPEGITFANIPKLLNMHPYMCLKFLHAAAWLTNKVDWLEVATQSVHFSDVSMQPLQYIESLADQESSEQEKTLAEELEEALATQNTRLEYLKADYEILQARYKALQIYVRILEDS